MTRTPSAIWIVDTNKEHLAVEEARKLKIPIIGILDTNCDPDDVDFPIPGNDDAIRAVGLLTRVIADAVAEGLIARSGAKTGEVAARRRGAAGRVGARAARWRRREGCRRRDRWPAAAETPAAEATGASSEGAEAAEAAERRRRGACRRGHRRGAAAEAPAAEAPAAEAPAAEAGTDEAAEAPATTEA